MADSETISKPALGDRFSVVGANQWKTGNDIEEVVYKGEMADYSYDEIVLGTLVLLRGSRHSFYVIKATANRGYYCEKINGHWQAPRSGCSEVSTTHLNPRVFSQSKRVALFSRDCSSSFFVLISTLILFSHRGDKNARRNKSTNC